jgi:hypothetical protein
MAEEGHALKELVKSRIPGASSQSLQTGLPTSSGIQDSGCHTLMLDCKAADADAAAAAAFSGTEAHQRHSSGDPAYSAANATGKNAGPASGRAQGNDMGGSAQQAAGTAWVEHCSVCTVLHPPGRGNTAALRLKSGARVVLHETPV